MEYIETKKETKRRICLTYEWLCFINHINFIVHLNSLINKLTEWPIVCYMLCMLVFAW